MPAPYAADDAGSVEAVADAMSDLPDEVLALDMDGEGAEAQPEPTQAEEAAQRSEEPEPAVDETEAEAAAEEQPEDAEPEPAEAANPAEDMVEIDGQSIPLSSLVEAHRQVNEMTAQNEQLRTQYTQGAQAKVDEILNPLMAERQQVIQTMQLLMQQNPLPPEPDIRLLDANSDQYNPEAFNRQRAQYETAKRGHDQFNARIQEQQQRLQQEQSYATERFREEQRAALLAKRPEWGDSAFQQEVVKDLGDMYGMDMETISSVMDARFYDMALDARAYRQLQQNGGKPAAEKVKRAAPKLVKGRAKTEPQSKERRRSKTAAQRLRQTGKLHDAAAAFEEFL